VFFFFHVTVLQDSADSCSVFCCAKFRERESSHVSSLRETHKPRCGNKYPRRERVPAETTMPEVLGDTTRAPAPRHIFAIVCCVRSTKVQTSLNETSLYRTLYPSLRDTVTPRERKLWRVRLYLCADDDDQLCSSSTLRRWRPTLRSASRRRSSSFRRAPTECPVARRRSRRASTAAEHTRTCT
jgi:hypothetical protein